MRGHGCVGSCDDSLVDVVVPFIRLGHDVVSAHPDGDRALGHQPTGERRVECSEDRVVRDLGQNVVEAKIGLGEEIGISDGLRILEERKAQLLDLLGGRVLRA